MKHELLASLRMMFALTVLLGFAYPGVIWAIGRTAFRDAANGSFLRREEGSDTARTAVSALAAPSSSSKQISSGRIVGSSLIGQSFASKKFFHSRPSAAGPTGYDATASGGTNLGPTSQKLADSIRERVATLRAENASSADSTIPADAVTSSASGLDPHISPEYARLQIPRVSRESRIPAADLEALVSARTERRFLGIYGEPRVNVLLLNLDLDARTRVP